MGKLGFLHQVQYVFNSGDKHIDLIFRELNPLKACENVLTAEILIRFPAVGLGSVVASPGEPVSGLKSFNAQDNFVNQPFVEPGSVPQKKARSLLRPLPPFRNGVCGGNCSGLKLIRHFHHL